MERHCYAYEGLSFYHSRGFVKRIVVDRRQFTPQYIFGPKFWAYVICAYIFQGTVCFFVWWNYRVVYKLRRAYFNSPDYKSSLHSRTLLVSRTFMD